MKVNIIDGAVSFFPLVSSSLPQEMRTRLTHSHFPLFSFSRVYFSSLLIFAVSIWRGGGGEEGEEEGEVILFPTGQGRKKRRSGRKRRVCQ